ncbi:MAG: 1-acyl-sn-glycerol-3-phosphate acyltransferase [Blastocatellia bacterium]|nr:1-acyl-sn-glycerol-3-phosphate acyltransferase [Blastocatellia bacterium]
MLWILKTIIHSLFRILFTLEYYGVENVPKKGAVVLAGNHPSYLDPLLISLPINRKIRFIAWDRLFKVPVLGFLLDFAGAFPVDITRRDAKAFEQAMAVLQQGDALGIFPEAGRSKGDGINEQVKTGAARFAINNVCPLVPITITGAHDAWPASRLMPLPRKITVKFHKPIVLDPAECDARKEDPEFAREITERWRDKVEQRLIPSIKVTDKLYQLFSRPAWPLRVFEIVPLGILLISLIAAVYTGYPKLPLILPVAVFYMYLLADIWFLPQGRIVKALRDLSTPILLFAWNGTLLKVVNYPTTGVDFLTLGLALGSMLIPFYYANYHDSQRFMRGMVLSYGLALTIALLYPAGYGLHAALFSFAVCYCLDRRPMHWYFTAGGVLVYAAIFGFFARPFTANLVYYVAIGLVVDLYMRLVKFTAHDGRSV